MRTYYPDREFEAREADVAVLIARGYHGVGKVPEGVDKLLEVGVVDMLRYKKGGLRETEVGLVENQVCVRTKEP